MGRKSKKQRAIDLLKELNQTDLNDIREFLDEFELGSPDNFYFRHIEGKSTQKRWIGCLQMNKKGFI